jgi:flagellar biosynthesis protein FlhF
MRTRTFSGATPPAAIRQVRDTLGDDALVLRTMQSSHRTDIVVTTTDEVYRFGAGLRLPVDRGESQRRPRVIALVGPTGAGKTTTVAKLALSNNGFAWGRVGLISLDTYKIGALDQIQTYADVGGLTLELLGSPTEVPGVLSRLAQCDTILVDTPGRTPRADASEHAWRDALRAIAADETHLVLSAGVRLHVADAVRRDYADLGVTHALLTKLDEIPEEAGVAQLADRLDLPTRWITDGQCVPDDLHQAPDRIMSAAFRGHFGDFPVELAV